MLKPGDQVIMNGKYYMSPKSQGRIFTVATEPREMHGRQFVRLEGKFGTYPVDGLTKIQQVTFENIEKEAAQ